MQPDGQRTHAGSQSADPMCVCEQVDMHSITLTPDARKHWWVEDYVQEQHTWASRVANSRAANVMRFEVEQVVAYSMMCNASFGHHSFLITSQIMCQP